MFVKTEDIIFSVVQIILIESFLDLIEPLSYALSVCGICLWALIVIINKKEDKK